MIYPFGRTVTAYREVRDQFGDRTRTDEVTLHGVAVAPRTSNEPGGDRRTALVTTGLTMFVPGGQPRITAQHRVVLDDGQDWAVQGEPGDWASPFTGWAPGYQVELDRVEG